MENSKFWFLFWGHSIRWFLNFFKFFVSTPLTERQDFMTDLSSAITLAIFSFSYEWGYPDSASNCNFLHSFCVFLGITRRQQQRARESLFLTLTLWHIIVHRLIIFLKYLLYSQRVKVQNTLDQICKQMTNHNFWVPLGYYKLWKLKYCNALSPIICT